jgi:trigger factor
LSEECRYSRRQDGWLLKVSTEKTPDSQVVMTIEVEPERLEEARGKALRKLAPRAKVPGFRPGKAPPEMLRRYLGEERILDEALDTLVPVLYREAVEADESIDPIARPRLEIETMDPLVVKATIPVRPTVELGDYHAIRVDKQPITVEESRVDEALEALRKRAATLEPAERELRWNDVVRMDVDGEVEGEKLVDQQDVEVQLNEERRVLFPGFEEQLLGHSKGDVVEFELAVPEEVTSEKFAGKQCRFKVTIREIKEEILPELDDEFAKQAGDGYESIDALRERVRGDIREYEEQQQTARLQSQVVDEALKLSKVEYPPVMLDSEVERMIHDQAGHVEEGRGLEAYLAAIGKSEEQVREEFKPIADERLRRSLVLTEIAEAETIDVSDEDVDAEIDRLSASGGAQAQQLRELFSRDEGRRTIRRNLLTRKTLDRLIEIAAPDGDGTAREAEPVAKAKRKPRAKKTPTTKEPESAAVAADQQIEGQS